MSFFFFLLFLHEFFGSLEKGKKKKKRNAKVSGLDWMDNPFVLGRRKSDI